MYSDYFQKAEDVKRTPEGNVECGQSHAGGGWYRSTVKPRPAATQVFVDYRDSGKAVSVTALCNLHAGRVKAQITKGSYGYRNTRLVEGVTPNTAALNPTGFLDTLTKAKQDEMAAQQKANEEYRLNIVRGRWDEMRANYNAPVEAADIERNVTLTSSLDDYWARVFVHVQPKSLSPNEARALAARLIEAADAAETLTNTAMKP
jgi:hypothetical protein